MSYTPKQKEAIFAEGDNITVSASAGSGKTMVIIERILRIITEGKADIDRILCVTFTKAAAREMKERLLAGLSDALATAEDKELIKRQIDLLPIANISTIHSFCSGLIKEYFFEAGIDSAFTVLNEADRKTLANRAIDELFEDLYEKNDENLALLLPIYFHKRKDAALKGNIISIFSYITAEAEPEKVLEKGEFYYSPEGIDFLAQTEMEQFHSRAMRIAQDAESVLNEFSDINCEDYANFIKQIRADMLFVNKSNADDARSYCAIIKMTKPSVTKLKGFANAAGYDEAVKNLRENAQTVIDDVLATFTVPLAEEKRRAAELLPVYRAIAALVKMYGERYARLKQEENAVDFSDLEHIALNLLKNEDVAKEVKARFSYVFADEYQDVNGVQEAIITAVSNKNAFMVGDVKQSIYAFRGCNPEIFASKIKQFKDGGGIAISLDKNFRTTQAILQYVNNLFCAIMTEKEGKVDYAANPMEYGDCYPHEEGVAEMYIVPKAETEKVRPEGVYSVLSHLELMKKNNDEVNASARAISRIIMRELGTAVYDSKKQREFELEYKHFAILLRSTKSNADVIAKELVRAGIPVSTEAKTSIADYPEVAFCMDLLNLINSSNSDIALASVLKSPVGNLTEAELLTMRKAHKKGSFFECYLEYLGNDDALAQKLRDFQNYLTKIRLLSQFYSCDRLLGKIICDKSVDTYLLSQRLGEQRLERLNCFVRATGENGRTVAQFLKVSKAVLAELSMNYTAENSVSIMSIHSSKGLEFPVVILPNCEKAFNTEDIRGEVLINRKYGLALEYINVANRTKEQTLFRQFMKRSITKELREEEQRLLYVALTRAKNKLFVLASAQKNKNGEVVSPIADFHTANTLEKANCYAKMLAKTDANTSVFDVADDNEGNGANGIRQLIIGSPDEDLKKIIKANINFSYGFMSDTALSVKRSVTSAVHYSNEEIPVEKHPVFVGNAAETGTCYHHFLELCDFYQSADNQLIDLYNGGKLTDRELEILDKDKLNSILNSGVYSMLKGYEFFREFAFTAMIPDRLIEQTDSTTEVLVQGIIDLLAIKGDEAVLVDYKFSSITDDAVLSTHYLKQLELYTYAVEKVLKKKVTKAILFNIKAVKAVEVAIDKKSLGLEQ